MYKINNILLSNYGIIPGLVSKEGISVKGIFDLPERIGITHKDWGDEDGVEPYVDADEIFLGGRVIFFNGVLRGDIATTEGLLANFKAAIALFKDIVPFETPYGTSCVYIKSIKPKFYDDVTTFLMECYEPDITNSCGSATVGTIYYSAVYSEDGIKNNCNTGYTGSTVTLSSTLGQFTSTLSQEAADQLAIIWVRENKQLYANINGTCTVNPTTYYNVKITNTLTRDDCGGGAVGSVVSFTVDAFTYSSLISQVDADAQAQAYLDSILTQAYANENGSCTLLPYFKLLETDYEQTSFLWGAWKTHQYFEIGEVIIAGTTYNMMIYGIQYSYTSLITDTPQSIADWFVLWLNVRDYIGWNDMFQFPWLTALSEPEASRPAGTYNQILLKIQQPDIATVWVVVP